jgi:hypothetical protein
MGSFDFHVDKIEPFLSREEETVWAFLSFEGDSSSYSPPSRGGDGGEGVR